MAVAPVRLADLTTIRLGGPATAVLEPESEADLVAAISDLDRAGTPLLLVGAGSNLVVADVGFDGTVVRLGPTGTVVDHSPADGTVSVTAAAGENWDDLVARCVSEGWAGLEALSGIPGLTGATPVQNVGAYGQEVSQTIRSVRVLDRDTGAIVAMPATMCGFGYRSSIFKQGSPRGVDRYVVLSVTFGLRRAVQSGAVEYVELARLLGASAEAEGAPLIAVREAVLQLRRSKGMVLDSADRDTASAGSFFTNPVMGAEAAARLPAAAPTWPDRTGRVKISAAWLIEGAGFVRGYGVGSARISSKHTLALTNVGGATTADMVTLAREIRDRVRQVFGIELEPEPRLVGCAL